MKQLCNFIIFQKVLTLSVMPKFTEKIEFARKKRVRFFNTAIDAIFKNWHALQLAVAHVSLAHRFLYF